MEVAWLPGSQEPQWQQVHGGGWGVGGGWVSGRERSGPTSEEVHRLASSHGCKRSSPNGSLS